jgi:hypothetical protein
VWNLGQVQRSAIGDDTDSDTENQTTDNEQRDGSGDDDLQDGTDRRDHHSGLQRAPATEKVTHKRGGKRADEFACLDDGRKEGLVGGRDIVLAVL